MGSLFWRLFLALWLSIMAFAAISTWVHVTVSRQDIPDSPEVAYERNIDKAERMITAGLRRGGEGRVREGFQQLPRPVRNQLYLFDPNGREILGRQRVQGMLEHDGVHRQTREIVARDGGTWSLVVLRRPPPPLVLEPGDRGIFLRLMIAALISALVSWFLARSLVRPLDALGAAGRQWASGDLKARVKDGVAGRRDEFGVLARDLDDMAARLDRAQQANQRLLRDVSHELRSPLARQRVALELARNRSAGTVTAELDRIELESERLEVLLNEVLDLLRESSQTAPFRPEPFDLGELLNDLSELVEYELPDDGSRLHRQYEPCLPVHADRELLWRALENLLRNAVLHSSPPAEITLTAESGKDSLIRVQVKDRGPGVPEGQLAAIFDPFSRVEESRDRASGGHGLGLAIAAAAVQRHRGSIAARNRSGGGLVIDVLLPIGEKSDPH